MASISSPEVVIACLSFLLSFLAISLTCIVICQEDCLWKCIHLLTNNGLNRVIRHKPKRRHTDRNTTGSIAAVSNRPVPWEDIFTVPVSTDTASNAVLKEGTCIKCKKYTAKKNCKYSACGWCCRGNPASVCRAHSTGYTAACNELHEALQYGYLEVDISYSNLKTCPTQLCSLQTHVVSLNLSNNRLTSIPEGIGQLTGLKELFLQYNDLSYLPDAICHLTALQELDVKSNSLSTLPPLIGRLCRLHTLCLMNNSLTSLPVSIGLLDHLEELSLHSNDLQCLPPELCELRSLKLLYCGENKLSSLPKAMGHLTLLEELDLSHNQLVSLPPSLCDCVSLVRLWLTGNRLDVLPVMIGQLSHLKELHLRRNNLRYFPPSIAYLQLSTFSAQFNPILKERQATLLNHTPKHNFPPLLELAARTVSAKEVPYSKGDIPVSLQVMLSSGTPCSGCGQTVFIYYSRTVVFQIVGVYYRLPLCHTHCEPHTANMCAH